MDSISSGWISCDEATPASCTKGDDMARCEEVPEASDRRRTLGEQSLYALCSARPSWPPRATPYAHDFAAHQRPIALRHLNQSPPKASENPPFSPITPF